MMQIFYFTGTGNGLATAKTLCAGYDGAKLVPITAELCASPFALSGVNVVILPSYAYGMPRLMFKFFRRIEKADGYLAIFVTYGSSPGVPFEQAKRLVKRHKSLTLGYFGIQCAENYTPIFGAVTGAEARECADSQNSATVAAIERLQSCGDDGKKGFTLHYSFVSALFRVALPVISLGLRITKDCTGCGVCVRVCPAAAIKVRAGKKPRIKKLRCQHCQGCLNICPKKAVKFINFNKDTPRYIHPDITVNELIKR